MINFPCKNKETGLLDAVGHIERQKTNSDLMTATLTPEQMSP